MLRAYLDDSGTHENSDVVVMGGIIATEQAWALFEPRWAELLDRWEIDPAHAHMNRCRHRSASSFKGWSTFKRQRALTEFRRLVISTGGRMLASAVSRKAWDAACEQSKLRTYFADPIDFLQAHCTRRALESKRKNLIMGKERISVVFDRRVQSLVTWGWMTDGWMKNARDRFAGYSFGEAEKVLPLQAADMIAYEAFVFQCDRERQGKQPEQRPNFSRLMNGLAHSMGFFTKEALLTYARDIEQRIASRLG